MLLIFAIVTNYRHQIAATEYFSRLSLALFDYAVHFIISTPHRHGRKSARKTHTVYISRGFAVRNQSVRPKMQDQKLAGQLTAPGVQPVPLLATRLYQTSRDKIDTRRIMCYTSESKQSL